MNPEDIKHKYVLTMGDELGTLYYALWQELAALYTKWNEYKVLFGSKPSRIELMNEAAPTFFRLVQDSLFENVILHIARLTDKAKTYNKNANLSIQWLSELVTDDGTKKHIAILINKAIEQTDFCRDWRNRRIAHCDLELATKENLKPLKPATSKKVENALATIADVLNIVSKYYLNSTTLFDMAGGAPGSTLCLLYVIADGLQVERERRARIEKGKYLLSDLEPRKEV